MTRPLVERLRQQGRQCAAAGSPLTAALLAGAADDYDARGVVHELLAPEEGAPAGSVPPLRFAGALHRLVLERRAPELALHYPSVGGTAPVQDVWPAAERACHDHLEELRLLLARPVQTNEVGRSAALWGALGMLGGGPVRLLELGASAGLNLRCDAFAYVLADGRVLGDPASPVRLEDPWRGQVPAYTAPVVVERRGCDPGPLDPATTEGRLTLTSYVWADQAVRLARLRAALRVAARVPAVVERMGALEFLRRELADLPSGVTTVVWHSVVMQYVDPGERAAVEALLDDVGRASGPDAPLVRVGLEPERVGHLGFDFAVTVQRWPGGRRARVADALGHGPPVTWRGATLDG